ncbi:sterol desaturase family protein [Shimia sp. CNT1-13L.2]|uniref:sterol desaturase family protein n=1 Tax=Shimia sp. CNT1-13L.2 TaxID=2959663 RepID=UPI0020CF76C4|nr:sterol desaturase family protein [Shimia sp. CNT1-13L.2]MCP9482459.1 sterol desaturase family protein [Shimia sp. CNT1-13L.2]
MTQRKEWNYTPDLPLGVNPLFQWPLRPVAILRWYWDSWFPISINLGIVGLAYLSYFWSSPTLEDAAQPGFWIAEIWLRNCLLVLLLAHGLHLVFHRYQLQGTDHKYDPRPFPRQGRVFTFGNQLHDNMFWAIASGVTVWSGYEVLIWWSMSNGFAPVLTWAENPVWFVAIFFLIPIWESFYFYWIHRLLHAGPFYRFHALHHRNTDIGPWSGLSMHPVEHLFYFGTIFVHFFLPTHPVHLICHLMFYGLYAIITHTGFEGVWAGGRKRLHLGNFHHQLHHRYFEVNYGTLEVPWDKLFGTFHDGSAKAKEMMRERIARRRNQS